MAAPMWGPVDTAASHVHGRFRPQRRAALALHPGSDLTTAEPRAPPLSFCHQQSKKLLGRGQTWMRRHQSWQMAIKCEQVQLFLNLGAHS